MSWGGERVEAGRRELNGAGKNVVVRPVELDMRREGLGDVRAEWWTSPAERVFLLWGLAAKISEPRVLLVQLGAVARLDVTLLLPGGESWSLGPFGTAATVEASADGLKATWLFPQPLCLQVGERATVVIAGNAAAGQVAGVALSAVYVTEGGPSGQ